MNTQFAHPYYSDAANKKMCSVAGCDRKARSDADGQPACSMHYQRWVKRRSFDLPPQQIPLSADGLCTVNGCKNRVQSKNSALCATHYFRIKRGSADWTAPRRTNCARCGTALTGNQLKFCSTICTMRAYWKVPNSRECKGCGEPFELKGKSEVCSKECAAIRDQRWKSDPRTIEEKRKRGSKRRAIQRGVQYEDFYHSEIFRRDRWICQICLTPVDRSKTFPHHLSPSIDHIIPLCKGGPHRRSNVQCAHWICNIRKSRRPILRLEPPA